MAAHSPALNHYPVRDKNLHSFLQIAVAHEQANGPWFILFVTIGDFIRQANRD